MSTALLMLAAGASRRIGAPKALLELGGRSFLQRILDTARAAGLSPLLVTLAGDDAVLRGVLPADVEAVVNDDLAAGPMGGVRRAVALLEPREAVGGLLLWPVDAPRVGADTVAALLAASHEAEVVVPGWREQTGHPAYFARATFARFLDPAVATPREVQAADGVRCLVLRVEDAAVLDDVDTPDDYDRLRAEEGEA